MSKYIDLSGNDMDLIGGGLTIMMTENAKVSMGVTEKEAKQRHELLSLELLLLSSKINMTDMGKYIELSLHEVKLIKSALLLLADFIYQKSLAKTEKEKLQYYDSCNLQLLEVRNKISTIEANKSYLVN